MWGSRGRRAPYPPVTVQSLNSPVVRVFVQSHSHSPGRRFPSGSENHARSQLRHPRSARNPALSVTRKYRPHDTLFRFRVPTASKTLKKKNPHSVGRKGNREKAAKVDSQRNAGRGAGSRACSASRRQGRRHVTREPGGDGRGAERAGPACDRAPGTHLR